MPTIHVAIGDLAVAVRLDRIIQRLRRDGLLNLWYFDSLLEAQATIGGWRIDYRNNRPHSAHVGSHRPSCPRLDRRPTTPTRITFGPL